MARASRNSVATSPFDDEGTVWRGALRAAVNALAIIATFPLALPARVEQWLAAENEGWFQLSAQLLAGVPGYPGVWLRRAYYWWTLEHCSLRVFIGYGAYSSHRTRAAGRSCVCRPLRGDWLSRSSFVGAHRHPRQHPQRWRAARRWIATDAGCQPTISAPVASSSATTHGLARAQSSWRTSDAARWSRPGQW